MLTYWTVHNLYDLDLQGDRLCCHLHFEFRYTILLKDNSVATIPLSMVTIEISNTSSYHNADRKVSAGSTSLRKTFLTGESIAEIFHLHMLAWLKVSNRICSFRPNACRLLWLIKPFLRHVCSILAVRENSLTLCVRRWANWRNVWANYWRCWCCNGPVGWALLQECAEARSNRI